MSPNTQDIAVGLSDLDSRLKTILKFKLREFVHLNPCFNLVTSLNDQSFSIDVRNQRRILNLDNKPKLAFKQDICPYSRRIKLKRRKVQKPVYI